MNLGFQLSMPIDLALKLREKLRAMEELHEQDVQRFVKRARGGGDTDKILEEQKALTEQGRRITIQYLMRALLIAGLGAIEQVSPRDMLTMLLRDPVISNREARRGPRAA